MHNHEVSSGSPTHELVLLRVPVDVDVIAVLNTDGQTPGSARISCFKYWVDVAQMLTLGGGIRRDAILSQIPFARCWIREFNIEVGRAEHLGCAERETPYAAWTNPSTFYDCKDEETVSFGPPDYEFRSTVVIKVGSQRSIGCPMDRGLCARRGITASPD